MSIGVVKVKQVVALAILLVGLCGKWVGAEVHHVVGGDRGWDPSTDVGSWSSGRTFRVGDKIWFTYSMVHGNIAELKTKEEYESCDVTNPIRMYTDGLDNILLEEEGIRYFVSSNSKSCKKGLKLHVEVMPQRTHDHDPDSQKVSTSEGSASTFADGPTPSGTANLGASYVFLVAGFWLSYLIFMGI
ncbi:hypothetical protein JCGZ_03951 [Jatropha curcas]|uniref:Phytocyanin domain-containing protein n=1 Tax=Jatropha curcas TaxID=180498 RepID=A0A067KW67_JATCU|nr:stellacyanin [Jatropha curcas]KDP40451.1 hypothetical protein JCGZ_03951 [Jatropha curcas]